MKNIATAAGTIALRLVKIGATQTAINKLNDSNRKDMRDMTDLEKIQAMKERKMNFKVITKETEEKELIEKKSFATKAKETAKVVGYGTANLMKIGAKQQVQHSLNELNREDMKQMHGQAARVIKYQVSPKLKNIKKIEA